MSSQITLITQTGNAMLAAFSAGGAPYASAKIAVGDGNGAGYTPVDMQIALINELWRGTATVAIVEDRVVFQATLPLDIGGFTIREVGVLLGDEGAEDLFMISQFPTTQKIAAPENGAGTLTVGLTHQFGSSAIGAFPLSLEENSVLNLSQTPFMAASARVTAPPGSPADGDLYAIASGATGSFSGKGGFLAERVDGTWLFRQPRTRTVIRVPDGTWYQCDGADWTQVVFAVTAWEDVTGKPATFPPSDHTHPQSEVTNLVSGLVAVNAAIAGKVAKAGDTMTGALSISVADSANALAIYGGAAIRYSIAPINAGGGYYDTQIYRYGGSAGSGAHAAFRNDGSTRFYGEAHVDGNLGAGTTSPTEKLHVVGNAKITANATALKFVADTTSGANGFDLKWGGSSKWSMYGFDGSFGSTVGFYGYSGSPGLKFAVGQSGEVSLTGGAGSANQVLASGGSGATAAWRNVNDLIDLAALRIALNLGRKVIAIGYLPGRYITPGQAITFSSTEPDTSYSGAVITIVPYVSGSQVSDTVIGTITAKTTSGCTITPNTGISAPSGADTFYILYR